MVKQLTVKDLKEKLKDLPDDMVVVHPDFAGHDGYEAKSFESFKKDYLDSKEASFDKPVLSVVEVKNQKEEVEEVFAIGLTSAENAMTNFGYQDDETFRKQFFAQGISEFVPTK